jgi:hypothetical protein
MTPTPFNGVVTLVKSLAQHDIWLAEPFNRAQAWVDLLLLANDQPRTIRLAGQEIQVECGQLAWSNVSLADRWRWSRPKVIGFLNELAERGMIKLAPNNRTTLITIVNYRTYNRRSDTTTDSTVDTRIDTRIDSTVDTRIDTRIDSTVDTRIDTEGRRNGIGKGYICAGASAEPSQIAQAEAIVAAYPVQTDKFPAIQRVLEHLEAGEDAAAMLAGTKAIAQVIAQIPSRHLNKFVPGPLRFFGEKKWTDNPSAWVARFAAEVKDAGMAKAFAAERPPEGARRTMKNLLAA